MPSQTQYHFDTEILMLLKNILFVASLSLLFSACTDNGGKTYGDMDYIYPWSGDEDTQSDGDLEHIYIPPEDGDEEMGDHDDGIIVDGGWQSCPLYSDGTGPTVECSKNSVPLDYAEPDGETIPFFVMRYKSEGESSGQLWLLQGGPGGPGSDFAGFMESMHLLYPSLDLYAPDHRGTGYSARLGCPDQERDSSSSGFNITSGEWPACVESLKEQWGVDGLAQFSASNAARDLGETVELFKEPGKDLFIYGASYGTYWALRYMQLYPDQGAKMILDSICASGYCKLVEYDSNFNMVGKQFMDHCASDEFCRSKLGDDAWAFIGNMLDGVDSGSCAALSDAGLDRSFVRQVFGTLITSWFMRPYIAMMAYRLERCSSSDVDFLLEFLNMLFSDGDVSVQDKLFSTALNSNITFSELWGEGDVTQDDLKAIIDGAYVSPDAAWYMAGRYDMWPKYEKDEYYSLFADFSGPILMMNGTLDPQTTLEMALPMKDIYTAENQYFIEFPRLPHGVIFQTPDLQSTDMPCGLNVFFQYLDNPETAPDFNCVADIPAINWAGDALINKQLFGTEDVYEGTISPSRKSAIRREVALELERVRRLLRERNITLGSH